MKKLVRQYAASAEERASASEELSTQAEQIIAVVGQLVAHEDSSTRTIVMRKSCSISYQSHSTARKIHEPVGNHALSKTDHVFHYYVKSIPERFLYPQGQ